MRKKKDIGQIPSLTKRWIVKLRNLYKRIVHLHGDPHYIAIGLALGVFVGITPTIPFHTVIAIGLAFVFKGSKAAAAIGVWVSNPITFLPLYIGSYRLGKFILGRHIPFDPGMESFLELLKQGWDITMAMMLGGAVLGLIPAIVTYFVARVLFGKIAERRARRKAAKTKSAKAPLADECN